MATLTPVVGDRSVVAVLAGTAADANGDAFPNTGKEVFVCYNGSVADVDLTIPVEATVDGQPGADLVVTVPAGECCLIGPFPPAIYNDAGDMVNVAYEDVTTVFVTVYKVNQA